VKALPLVIPYSVLTVWVSVFCQRRFVCQNRARDAICPLWFPAPETDQPLLSAQLTPARSEVDQLGRGQRSRIAAKKRKSFGIAGHCPYDTSTREENSLGLQASVWLTEPANKIHYACNNFLLSGGHRLQIMCSVWGHRSMVGTVYQKKKNSYNLHSEVTAQYLQKKKYTIWDHRLTHRRVTQICVFNTVNLGTSASSP